MIFKKKRVTIVEVGELVFFRSIECLRKSKLKNEFINQKKFKEITLGYIIGTSTLFISPQNRTDYLHILLHETFPFLSVDILSNLKNHIDDVMKLMRDNLDYNMGIREYLGILTKKYLLDLGKTEYDDSFYNMAYNDLSLYYGTLYRLFDDLSIDYSD